MIDVSVFYDQFCIKIPDNNSCQGLTGFKWQNIDHSTWHFISKDYDNHIEPALKNFLEAGILKTGNVIQAGGNCGLYALCLTKYFNMIFTFEPDPINFYCLVNNCQISQIVKFNLALGEKHSKVKSVIIQDDNRGMNKVEETPDYIYVPQVPLDIFDFDNVSLLMLDVEGMEYNVLKGAKKTLLKNKPMIILESYDTNYTKKIEKYLKTLGYELHSILGNSDRVYIVQ